MRPKVTFSTNKGAFKKDIINSMGKLNDPNAFKRELETDNGKNLFKEFEKLKQEMIKNFLNHPITKEILDGPNGTNSSGTLGGYGNLFTFIGFNKSDRPIDPIIELLSQTNFNCSRMVRGVINITVEIPSRDQIFRATPLPWAPGISWAQRIEIGMSGLGMYMNKNSSTSRSGAGIQTQSKIRGGRFTNTQYITAFLNRWAKQFAKLTGGNIQSL
ncbi:MAG: hypothetical protein CMK23_06035 [Porticoccaceae bacterium]|nr:hypothetical protein [Porticoccaceae bacterium]